MPILIERLPVHRPDVKRASVTAPMMRAMRTVLLAFVLSIGTVSVSVAASNGSLIITGSDTMAGLVTAWSSDFRRAHPDITIEIQASGSAAAPTALAEGTVNIGAMSRRMSDDELQQFIARRGYPPTPIVVGRDALALVVHPDNPIDALSRPQVDQLFSITGQCGGWPQQRRWSALDPSRLAEFDRQVEPLGRTAISGSYGLFKHEMLCDGDYAGDVIELPGFAAIVDAVAQTPGAVGYVGLGFVDARVKVVSLRLRDGRVVSPWQSAAGSYPLARNLYLYLALPPGQRPGALECEFLRYIETEAADSIVREEGFLTITRNDPALQGLSVHIGSLCV